MSRGMFASAAMLLLASVAVFAKSREAGADGISIAAGGDLIGPYKSLIGIDTPGLAAVAALFQRADAGYANQEGSLFDLDAFAGYPAAENGGGYPLAPAAVARDYRTLGISLVSKANNHATDYGIEGLLATLRSLSSADIIQAGSGPSETDARAPAFRDTDHGRVALISTASTFPPMSVAGPAVTRRGTTTRPRPGISVLHVRAVHLVGADQLASLLEAAGDAATRTGTQPPELRIGDEFFRASDSRGSLMEMDRSDEEALLSAVRSARTQARLVIFAIHAHQTAGNDDDLPAAEFEPLVLHRANEAPSPNDPRPAPFETALFHAVIDAGADLVIRTGPHVLNGIEIYRGRPIYYSLGSLFFDFNGRRSYTTPNGQLMRFPDEWFETVVPVTRFEGSRLADIRLYPLIIESSNGPGDGTPHPAGPEEARRILLRLQRQSEPFGTRIEIKDGVGLIRPTT